jgi:DivIVA domain-containing protein
MTPDEVHHVAFRKPPIGNRGYSEKSVDAVLDRIEQTLRGQPSITSAELANARFPKPPIGKRGYATIEVDQFLQRVIAEWPDLR